jgi:hypothetical protein
VAGNRLAVSPRRLAGRQGFSLVARLCAAAWSRVYVRPKIGFCNCDRGVADDDEVDRVADLDLMSQHFSPRAPGEVVRIADMPGRVRGLRSQYVRWLVARLRSASRVSRRCDLLVAVAHGRADAPEVRRAALEFLATREMTRWSMAAMEGQ